MNAKYKLMVLFLGLLLYTDPISAEESIPVRGDEIRTIDWSRFSEKSRHNDDLRVCSQILRNSARWGSQWIVKTYKLHETGDRFIVENENSEVVIRPPSSVALGLATAIKTGLAIETTIGVSEGDLTRRTVRLIKGVAALHKANGGNWGDHWQSSLWSGLLGRAGWMMWDELDEETRGFLCHMVTFEADRHITKNYAVPYWNGRSGDSKAEENSWEALILQLAVAMMPDHPHVNDWKRVCSELQISAYARESDMGQTGPILDGKTPQEWLRGYNLRQDGVLINHGLVHNDYMVCIAHLQMQGFIVFSLAGVPVPQTTDFNFNVIYNTLVHKQFESPPYKKPGGTMYIPGKPEVYYPQGTDWSVFRFDIFYNMDTYAAVLTHDAELAKMARNWMRIRGRKIYQMQERHEDGRIYAHGEFDRYIGAEQLALWVLSDSYLIQWLATKNSISEKGNWLANEPTQQADSPDK